MNFIHNLTLLLLFIFIPGANACPTAKKGCIENRAAFDVGSGVTRIVVAAVDKCEGRIVKELMYDKVKIPYKDELEISKDNALPSRVIQQGVAGLKELVEKSRPFHPHSYVGVATAVFRGAVNGQEVIDTLAKETGIKIHVIDHDKEAQIGFYGAIASTGLKEEEVVVWDIGSGSMQLVAKPKKGGDFLLYKGFLASSGFKNTIITKVQNRKLHGTISSPNPMTSSVVEVAHKIAENEAMNVHEGLKDMLSSGRRKIIGIGGVHYYSVRGQTGKDTFDLDSVHKTIEKRSKMSDKELGGQFASTSVSNLVLVAGFMKKLGIEQVQAVNVNMAHGLLVNESYW